MSRIVNLDLYNQQGRHFEPLFMSLGEIFGYVPFMKETVKVDLILILLLVSRSQKE